MGHIRDFIETHYLHFNAAALKDAAQGYEKHLQNNGKILITLAGAMSTAELGKSLAEMIRQDKVHAISCTGANLEEDIFNLVAHDHYERVPHYRDLRPEDEQALLDRHLNRVTDTCIPEEEAMRKIERIMHECWGNADKNNTPHLAHEYFYQAIKQGAFQQHAQIDPKDSWLIAACEKNLPLFVPGWEDSTLGNMFAAACLREEVKAATVKNGIEYMIALAKWYQETSKNHSIGFFQIGGGIAGDFPICVVPMLEQDMQIQTPLWGYFCQISDSTTSYGSYSGAIPNEKITWGKLGIDTPKYVIESDATIVAPLIFAYIMQW
ncbi:MAG: deoxyhypusine synthase family protein [Deltaproteobacteria bacterium]|nr:deoxyhypusine synthase family protein [Deltaproteobacteria bacterium]